MVNYFDKAAICARFFDCFPNEPHNSIAARFGVSRQSVDQWKNHESPVPWEKLKMLVDTFGICWDWLIEGYGPKERQHIAIESAREAKFDKTGINARFLSLFEGMTRHEVARKIGVSREAIQSWHSNRRQVPWERMWYAVHHQGVSWEWLISGRDPKFRL